MLRGAGVACLLGTIVLCQSVLAHNDGRARGHEQPDDRRVVHRYELVRVQKVSGDLREFTYRAWLTNFGAPLTGATATVTSLAKGTTVLDATLTFGAVGTGRSVKSADTFTVRHHRQHAFAWLWPTLRWNVTPLDGKPANRPPVANAGADRTASPGVRVALDGRASSDPDRDPLRFNWTLTRPLGSGASLSSSTSPTPTFMPDRRGTYEARLIVDDGSLPSDPDSVVITVQNSAPVANAGPDQTAQVAHVVTLDGSASSDPDGDPVSYQWALVSRPAGSGAVISDVSAASPTFLVDRPGAYTAQLVVSDGSASSAPDTVTVTTSNTAPVANAGPDQTAAVGATVSLNGSGSSDADGDPLTYAWTLQSAPAGSAATVTGAASVTPSLGIDRAGSYVVRLVVSDGQAASAADTVTISTVNSAPVANAGADQTAVVAQTVALNGSASSDVDGDPLAFAWVFVSRPAGSAAALTGANGVQPSFVVDRAGLYRVQLVVNDGALSSAADIVEIQTLNSAPVANAGPDQSGYVGQTVTLDGSGSTDVDGNALSYVWALTSRPAGSAAAVSDPMAVMPTLVLDRAGVYVAQLIVNDGTVPSPADTVSVTTLNSAPVANAGADVSVVAGRVVSLVGDASSDVDGDVLTYSWALIQRPAGSSAALSGAAGAAASFQADRPGVYIAQLIVNDGSVDSAPDTVTITTGNTAPVALAGADQPSHVGGELATLDGTASFDADGHAIVYRWSLLSVPAGSAASLSDPAAPSPWFALDRAGQYVAQLIVNDGFQDSAPDTVVVTVVNRAPVADAGSDQAVFTGGVASVTAAASADPDGDPLTYEWTFTSVPAGSAAALSGASSVAASFTPDMVGAYTLSLTVTDPSGATSSDSVMVSAATPATVTVLTTDAVSSENSDNGVFTFSRTGSTAAALVVRYTLGGTATNGTDYASRTGLVTIPAGQGSATVSIVPVNDSEFEGTETVDVTVEPDAAYSVGSPSAATLNIADNDRPTVTIAATDASASESGDTGTFTITRTGPTTASLRVTFVVGGTASNGTDYAAIASPVFIPAGSSTLTLTVAPADDGVAESNENVDITLTPNTSVVVGSPNVARVVIVGP
jgi:hypothetical protein